MIDSPLVVASAYAPVAAVPAPPLPYPYVPETYDPSQHWSTGGVLHAETTRAQARRRRIRRILSRNPGLLRALQRGDRRAGAALHQAEIEEEAKEGKSIPWVPLAVVGAAALWFFGRKK